MDGEAGGGHGATTGVWIVTAVMMIGTVLAGISLILWWLSWGFWIGIAMIIGGGIGGYFTHIMDMVSEYAPPAAREIESG